MSQATAHIPKTPLMVQYFTAREEHPGVILLMRVGDFYEAYGEDAETIASALNITLTAREDGGGKVAMAGVPFHAVERYLARLIQQGFRVAIMEQVEDPKLAKGLVKRRVTRVVSKGTVFEESMLESRANNYLVAAVIGDPAAGIGVADVSTGEFLTTELTGEDRAAKLVEEIARLDPAEVLVPDGADDLAALIRTHSGAAVHTIDTTSNRRDARSELLRHFQTTSLRGFGCDEFSSGLEAAALVLKYLGQTQSGALSHITTLGTYSTREFMQIDATARRNLELVTSMSDGGRSRTLLGVIDHTQTALGARMLRRWIEEPLLEMQRINSRLDSVQALAADELLRGDLRDALKGVNDIERLVARCSAGLANGRDLAGLRESLLRLPSLAALACRTGADRLSRLAHALDPSLQAGLNDPLSAITVRESKIQSSDQVACLLQRAVTDEPPQSLRDGGLIRKGYSAELDALRSNAAEGREWIANLEQAERERTGIGSLKVGYNAVFGYYLEVTKANLSRVPEDYIRKQTTANAERYITPSLKEYESKVLGADEKAADLEFNLFVEIRDTVVEASAVLLKAAKAVAELDVFAGLAQCAVRHRYRRPTLNDDEVIDIRAGRHPVVESLFDGMRFVPNDCQLDCTENQLHILTGPNMAGKSTALRQVALITLLAQMGSFVPAEQAAIGIVDRIFTRVGAHDELATGQSTFMVEMNETASILNNATRRSLVLLDEIGRGTSTYDGLSIAWAVAEYLVQIGCKAMFATHYHQMNALAGQCSQVKNFRVAVKEQGDQVVWLHKVVPGGTDRSYGIQVARMAGIPPTVIDRAKEILKELERSKATVGSGGSELNPPRTQKVQLTLFEAEDHPVIEALRELDVSSLTPVEALVKLEELTRRAKG